MILYWIGFIIFILLFIAFDLGVFHRSNQAQNTRQAIIWTIFCIFLAIAFNVLIYFLYEGIFNHGLELSSISGKEAALQFFTGYLLEKSLSLDNIFVIALIFSYYHIPREFQHRVLTWGIIGAIVFRGIMIAFGATLMHHFKWIPYVFGAFLLFTALRFLFVREENLIPKTNVILKFLQRFLPITSTLYDSKFFVKIENKWWMTPLFIALIQVESADVIFAVDSIPAIFAVTQDTFIVFTSNIFAILGLRSLYFVLSSLIEKFSYLKLSLSLILAFIGFKMLLSHYFILPIWISLVVIVLLLAAGILLSLFLPKKVATVLISPWQKDVEKIAEATYNQVRRTVVFIVGSVVVLIGIVLIFTPGPAILVIPLGILILSTEFVWAKRLLYRFKQFIKEVKDIPAEIKAEHPEKIYWMVWIRYFFQKLSALMKNTFKKSK